MDTTSKLYDDAELFAIEAIRAALTEYVDAKFSISAAIYELMARNCEQNGPDAPLAMVVALARHAFVHVLTKAAEEDTTPDAWLDEWALFKLEQHQLDDE